MYLFQVQLADQIMELAIKGIEFFQTYYKFELLLAITITMIGWLLILTEKLSTSDITRRFIYGKHKIEFFIIAILLLVIIAFNIRECFGYQLYIFIICFISIFFSSGHSACCGIVLYRPIFYLGSGLYQQKENSETNLCQTI